MKLQSLREEVLEANLELVRRGLVLYTFGNASGIAREEGLVVIKPSGVPYETMKPADLVVVDLEGTIVEGTLRPSSDLATHLDSLQIVYHYRRRSSHPLARSDILGPGATRDSLFWHNPRRLLSRFNSSYEINETC